MTQLNFDLSQFDDQFASEEIKERQFSEVPDGKYQVQVETVELIQSKTGNPMIKWQFHIHAPQNAGQKIWKNSVITEKTLGIIKSELFTCGVDLKKFSDLPNHLVNLLDVGLEIQKKTNGTDSQGRANVNIYINKKIDAKLPPIKKTPISATPGAAGPSILPNEIINIDDQFNAGDLPF